MISPKLFYEVLINNGVSFFTGIPDSLLKEFCSYLDNSETNLSHIIASNEGTAIAIAVGHHLANGGLPMVYLQNSGLGNTINPLLSLSDKEVYSIPLILLIGWRGEPGLRDEPQHLKQGRVTPALLDAMEIPYKLITKDLQKSISNTKWAAELAINSSSPVALLVQKDSFNKNQISDSRVIENNLLLSRENAISIIIKNIPNECIIVSTTGMISRELYEQRAKLGQDRSKDFMTVGSMGHASQIALGIAISNPEKKVICLDGDGSALMHLGGMTTIGTSKTGNLLHLVLNNAAHDSVGGQPTVADKISLSSIAKACCYKYVEGPLRKKDEIINVLKNLNNLEGIRFVEICVSKGARSDLGRPKESPICNKEIFISNIRK